MPSTRKGARALATKKTIAKPAYWFYYVFRVRQFGFAEGRDWLRQRVESNWAALIPPARAIIETQYRQVQELLRL